MFADDITEPDEDSRAFFYREQILDEKLRFVDEIARINWYIDKYPYTTFSTNNFVDFIPTRYKTTKNLILLFIDLQKFDFFFYESFVINNDESDEENIIKYKTSKLQQEIINNKSLSKIFFNITTAFDIKEIDKIYIQAIFDKKIFEKMSKDLEKNKNQNTYGPNAVTICNKNLAQRLDTFKKVCSSFLINKEEEE